MNNTLKMSFVSAAALALSAVSGFAQSSGHVSVRVPFEFTAGTSTLPAGEYSFREDRTGVMVITSLDAHKSVAVLTNAESRTSPGDQPSLKFDKVNGGYSLAEIEMVGEPSRRIVKMDAATGRPASLGSRAAAGSTSKSLTR